MEDEDRIITPKPIHNLGGHIESYTIQYFKNEIKRISNEDEKLFTVKPDDTNILVWYFLISGTENTWYYGGSFMGMIIFPPNYPFSPPEIQMISPTGRFATRKSICLSNTSYHQESWQPIWNIDKLLIGLISFMNSGEEGIGVLVPKMSDDKITHIANQSKAWLYNKCDIFAKVFREEYQILDQVYRYNIDDKYFLNIPINSLVSSRISLYQRYNKEIAITMTVYNQIQQESLLYKFFSPLTTNNQLKSLQIIPFINEDEKKKEERTL